MVSRRVISVPVVLSSQSVTAVYFPKGWLHLTSSIFHVSMFADDPLLYTQHNIILGRWIPQFCVTILHSELSTFLY